MTAFTADKYQAYGVQRAFSDVFRFDTPWAPASIGILQV